MKVLRPALFTLVALVASSANANECKFQGPSGASFWFEDPMTLAISDGTTVEKCDLLSGGTGIIDRGVRCGDQSAVTLDFLDEDATRARFRGGDWLWTCSGNVKPTDIGIGN